MAKLPELTDRQREVFDFIQERIRAWGYPPTIREIGEHFSIRSTNGVADHLKALKRKGYLTQEGMKSRTLRPAKSSRGSVVRAVMPKSGGTVSIPLLGRVAAGEPILAEERAEGSVVVDSFLVGDGRKLFALKVVGESMIDDGILDGDYIFVRKRSHAEPGEIVVAMIEDEATVKRYYPEPGRIRLQPANSAMEPIYIKESDFRETQLIGVVVGVYRKV
ncbi:MAG: repressor LexA [Deltaproteobacteria bacterium RIFOXYA12_FULL_58_15]|nr:MAG: repressor LexA [Deltaproteobacteria bacterium RIFOXYA12_FULL_58_15]OGR13157.1 MAG: repressor LexA [Deltaproteobacteria bacterium RIFOXYB12_FULL_58_9]